MMSLSLCKRESMQIAICLTIQQPYGLGVEAVQGPVGSRLGASVPLAERQQREQSLTCMAGLFQGLPLTLPGKEVLDGRELVPGDVLDRVHYPLQRLAVGCQAVAIRSGNASSQDALSGAGVELFEDLRANAFSSSGWLVYL